MKQLTKLQFLTILALLLYVGWELSVSYSKDLNPTVDAPLRIDLVFIYPILLAMIAASLYQWIKRQRLPSDKE